MTQLNTEKPTHTHIDNQPITVLPTAHIRTDIIRVILIRKLSISYSNACAKFKIRRPLLHVKVGLFFVSNTLLLLLFVFFFYFSTCVLKRVHPSVNLDFTHWIYAIRWQVRDDRTLNSLLVYNTYCCGFAYSLTVVAIERTTRANSNVDKYDGAR